MNMSLHSIETELFKKLVRWSPYYRPYILKIVKLLRLDPLLDWPKVARLLATKHDTKYQRILDTRPQHIPQNSAFELHMLVCEKDLIRTIWSLKSFFHYSALNPYLIIHNDGSLSESSLRILKEHFIGCKIPNDAETRIHQRLEGYPLCQFFRQKHFMAGKFFDVMLFSESEYIMVMDSDILWFSESPQISECIGTNTPFYVECGGEAYVRNRSFMEEHCQLTPAKGFNAGIIGFPRKEFLDLNFIEHALDKLINVSSELLPSSLGYFDPHVPDFNESDPVNSIVWWVMEQTLYALLFERNSETILLDTIPRNNNKGHQFVGAPITKDTATQHFISDEAWNAFFPVGAEYLINKGFLEKWG